jgi:D-serine deaminase-like pyridoxal phosphate-dependent protein
MKARIIGMAEFDNNDDALINEVKRLAVAFDVNDLPEIATPALLIDEVILDRNIARMAEYCREHSIALRPHARTHKSLEIARRQLAAGAIGLSVAKSSEGKVMTQSGANLLIAYPPITPSSLRTIDELRHKVGIIVAVDSVEAVELLTANISTDGPSVGVLVDIDLGLHRTGVGTPEESRQIAERVSNCRNLELKGLFCYPGHITELPDEQATEISKANGIIRRHLEIWKASGLSAPIISGGTTPTAYNSHLFEGVTEIRPGTYVFNDANTVRGGHCALADCAARVVTTVVSNAVADQVVVDAGSKTMARDTCLPQPSAGFGFVLEYPQARVRSLNEEHGVIDVSRCLSRPRLGERISIIPNHICPAVNLTDSMWLRTVDGTLMELPVDARGMVQ